MATATPNTAPFVYAFLQALRDSGLGQTLSRPELAIVVDFLTYVDGDGRAWPSAERQAQTTGMNLRNVERTRAALKQKGVLVVDRPSAGRTSTVWRLPIPSTPAQDTGVNPTPTPAQGTMVEETNPGAGRYPTPAQRGINPGAAGRATPAQGAARTIQELSNRTIQELSSENRGVAAGESDGGLWPSNGNGHKADKKPTDAQVDAIYRAYPRHLEPQAAKRAIVKALGLIASGKAEIHPASEGTRAVAEPAGWLLERTNLFAKSLAGQKGQFTPYPATWFNAGGYGSDPAEWEDRGGAGGDDFRKQQRAGEYAEPAYDDAPLSPDQLADMVKFCADGDTTNSEGTR
jgi:hypothetical protein